MEENIHQFGLNNITIIDHVTDETVKDLPVPTLTFLVASASMEQEIQCMLLAEPAYGVCGIHAGFPVCRLSSGAV